MYRTWRGRIEAVIDFYLAALGAKLAGRLATAKQHIAETGAES